MEIKFGSRQGTRNGNVKLSVQDVKDIKELLKQGALRRDIAKKYNIHKTNVGYIARGKTWRQVN